MIRSVQKTKLFFSLILEKAKDTIAEPTAQRFICWCWRYANGITLTISEPGFSFCPASGAVPSLMFCFGVFPSQSPGERTEK